MRLLTFSLLVGLALGVAATVAMVIGRTTWDSRSERLRDELSASAALPRSVFDTTELQGLPAPVARMLRSTLTPGQPLIASVQLEHRGNFDMGRDSVRWAPFRSQQFVTVRRPGFLWDARIRMAPGLPVFVHDAYIAGRGILTARLLGLITVMDAEQDDALADGEFLRWVAEAAWYPTALLPSQGAVWEPRDDSSATLTLRDGRVTATVVVSFDPEGRIARVRAERRARLTPAGPVPTPWEGRFWDYVQRDGMWIPQQGEVAWLMPSGARPYWRGEMVSATYAFAR